ncbi:MAG: ABC transporter permease [Marinobacter sp.]|nr:ABC transporter permease [Marinobacter sp.]
MFSSPNRVLVVLGVFTLILAWVLDFGVIQPNRIVAGTGYGLGDALGLLASSLFSAGMVVVLWLASVARRYRYPALTALLVVLLLALPWGLALFAERHLPGSSAYARTAMGAGFWCLLFLPTLMLGECLQRLGAGRGVALLLLALVILSWALAITSGDIDSLSLLKEYAARPDQFRAALWDHLALALSAVAISLVLAFALALLMIRRERCRRPVFGVVSFLQTIPSLALFGLLIAPLSALSDTFPVLKQLGVQGIGWAPALLALIAYSLLPMVRNSYVALTGVSPALLEAGEGMGMNPRQLFFRVKLPLAMPVIIEGVRVTTIQAIGLTAVAALIGAGGFGKFIFQGLGQAAMELVVLGALPTVLLALLADAVLSALSAAMRSAR